LQPFRFPLLTFCEVNLELHRVGSVRGSFLRPAAPRVAACLSLTLHSRYIAVLTERGVLNAVWRDGLATIISRTISKSGHFIQKPRRVWQHPRPTPLDGE
jgi:hypothetical protein